MDRRRLDETPLRSASVPTPMLPPSPGTPAQGTGEPRPVQIIAPGSVQQSRWTRRYQRLLGVSASSPLDGYVSDLVPAFLLGVFNPEDRAPDEIFGFAPAGSGAGGAGNFSRGILVNPLASGVLAVVTKIIVSAGAGGAVNYQVGTEIYNAANQPSVTLRGMSRDSRTPNWTGIGGAMRCFIHNDNNGATQFQNGPVLNRIVPANDSREWGTDSDPVVILQPGTGVVVTPSAANLACQLDIQWREIVVS